MIAHMYTNDQKTGKQGTDFLSSLSDQVVPKYTNANEHWGLSFPECYPFSRQKQTKSNDVHR